MNKEDIKVGHIYRAKKPTFHGFSMSYNDRQVLHINLTRTQVQYDSGSLGFGRRYPTVTIEQFLKFADQDVTEYYKTNVKDGEWDTKKRP